MKLFVVGATGRTGRHVIDQALIRGHSVTAVVRQRDMLDPRAGLLVVLGDPLQAHDLEPFLPGHDAVISCLGIRRRTDASILRDAAAATLAAMASSGLQRYLVISQGLLFQSWNPIVLLLKFILAKYVADSIAMERLIFEATPIGRLYVLLGSSMAALRTDTGPRPALCLVARAPCNDATLPPS